LQQLEIPICIFTIQDGLKLAEILQFLSFAMAVVVD
jgi:hypothetical protein